MCLLYVHIRDELSRGDKISYRTLPWWGWMLTSGNESGEKHEDGALRGGREEVGKIRQQ